MSPMIEAHLGQLVSPHVKRVKYLLVANGRNDVQELGRGSAPVALDAEIALEGLEVQVHVGNRS